MIVHFIIFPMAFGRLLLFTSPYWRVRVKSQVIFGRVTVESGVRACATQVCVADLSPHLCCAATVTDEATAFHRRSRETTFYIRFKIKDLEFHTQSSLILSFSFASVLSYNAGNHINPTIGHHHHEAITIGGGGAHGMANEIAAGVSATMEDPPLLAAWHKFSWEIPPSIEAKEGRECVKVESNPVFILKAFLYLHLMGVGYLTKTSISGPQWIY